MGKLHRMTKDINGKIRYGVRVFKVSEETLLIKQTIKRGNSPNDPYVIDGQKEWHVKIGNDSAIADAVRNGVSGKLTTGGK